MSSLPGVWRIGSRRVSGGRPSSTADHRARSVRRRLLLPALLVTLLATPLRGQEPDLALRELGGTEEAIEGLREGLDHGQEMVRALIAHDADDLIVFGTDTPNFSVPEGFQAELQLLSEAGLTPEQIPRGMTRNAAVHLGQEDDLGTLEAGKLADLIVVDGNPLEDLSVLQNVEMIAKGGEVVFDRGTNDP